MFDSLEEALEKAKPVKAAEIDGGETIEYEGVKFFIKSAKVESDEESFVGKNYQLSADGVEGVLAIVFAVPPKTPTYQNDKDYLTETHKKYSPEGTKVKDVDFYNVGGKLVVTNEVVMPIMGIKMHQCQLLFDHADKQVSITVSSPNKKFPVEKVAEEALRSLVITE